MSPTASAVFDPWTFAGKLSSDLHIASKVTGVCWEESIAAPRLDAYRCAEHNLILDPCFGSANGIPGNEVVCAYPSPESVTVMQVTKPLPTFSAPSSLLHPWLIVLANDELCYFAAGATTNPAGLRLNYGCNRNGDVLYGNVNERNSIWTVFEQNNRSATMTQVPIVKAYY
jgi:hypothetical protein